MPSDVNPFKPAQVSHQSSYLVKWYVSPSPFCCRYCLGFPMLHTYRCFVTVCYIIRLSLMHCELTRQGNYPYIISIIILSQVMWYVHAHYSSLYPHDTHLYVSSLRTTEGQFNMFSLGATYIRPWKQRSVPEKDLQNCVRPRRVYCDDPWWHTYCITLAMSAIVS